MAHSNLEITNRYGEKVLGNKWLRESKENKRGVVVIVHGMCEYSFRYNEFALFLNGNGYDVYALDHIGHGLNCPNKEDLGVWPKDGFDKCVDNVADLVNELLKETPDVFVFGHSMGSFVTQAFMERYPGLVRKIVLCGSSGPQALHKMGKVMASISAVFGPTKKGTFMNKLSFGGYNKEIKNPISKNAWLSWNEDNVRKYDEDEYCGYVPNKLFYKSFMKGLASLHTKANLAKIDKNQKVLMVVGQDDPVGNYSISLTKLDSIYKKLGIDSRLIVYPHMRHEILNEDKKLDVMNDTLNFLEK